MKTANPPVVSPVLRYKDGPAAIEWLIAALGFEKQTDHRTPDGAVAHADLRFGSGVIGVSSISASNPGSPWSNVRQGVYIQVDDPDAFHDRANAAGADIVSPLTDTDYGSRDFTIRDPGGRLFGFGTYSMGSVGGPPTLWAEFCSSDVAAAKEWLERAIGFTTRLAVPQEGDRSRLIHAELRLGESAFMISGATPSGNQSGSELVVHLRVEDPDAHCARARQAGAEIVREPQTASYGARLYSLRDPEGFAWWVSNYVPR
jgi:uncharacterized glyoxalase superfamily protein PhnB